MKETTTTIQNTPTNGADSTMNPPTTSNFADVAFAKEADKRNKSIKSEMKKINSSFEKIAFNLHWFAENFGYEQLGYKTIYDLAFKEYGIARGTTNNFINVVERFAERDADGKILEQIRPELRGFQSSKLIALLGVTDEEQLNEFTEDMSVREIKAKVKKMNEEPMTDSDTDAETEPTTDSDTDAETEPTTDSDTDAETEPTTDSDDITVEATEINRQTIISFSTLAEYHEYLDGMNDLIEKNLKSKAFKNGDKKIEIAIVW